MLVCFLLSHVLAILNRVGNEKILRRPELFTATPFLPLQWHDPD